MPLYPLLQLNKRLFRNSKQALIQKVVALVAMVILMAMILAFVDSVAVGLITLLVFNLAYDISKTKGNQLVDIAHFAVFPVSFARKWSWLFLADLLSPKTVLSLVWLIGCGLFISRVNAYFMLLAVLLFLGYQAVSLVLAFESVRIKGFTFVNVVLLTLLNFINMRVFHPNHFGVHPWDAYIEQYPVQISCTLTGIVILLLLGTQLYLQFRLPRNPFYSEYIKDTYNTDFWH
jgi:hypothetical protein